jgi:XTP/dITP diphosphohydrolase
LTKRLVIATHNKGKAAEIKTLLGKTVWTLLSLDEFPAIGEAAENAETYAGNAMAKAAYYAHATGEFVLADDSGLEVSALGGAPGVFSARYAGPNATDAERRIKLLTELDGMIDRTARFVCAAAIAEPDGKIVKITEGICEGVISENPRGHSGFGYDPIFVPSGYTSTFGELSDEIKNQISHRAKAIRAVRGFLELERTMLDRHNIGP